MAMSPKQLAAFGGGNKKPGGGKDEKKDDKKKGEPPANENEDGGEDHADEEDDDAAMVEEVAQQLRDGDGEQDLMEKMKDYDPESGTPEWVADEEVWKKAKEAVDPEGEGAGFDEPWAVVAHVYRRMGGGDK